MAEEGGGGGGISSEELIAQAAIKADMEHRHFRDVGGGTFELTRSRGGGTDLDAYAVWTIRARDGSITVEMSNPKGKDIPEADPAKFQYLQADVFDYWPRVIDDMFRKWQDEKLPSWGVFAMEASYAKQAADELRPGTTYSETGKEIKVGNGRMGADLVNMNGELRQLSGAYVSTFNQTYVTPLPGVLQGQFALATVLGVALETEKEIWLRVSRELGTLKYQARNAMAASGPKGGAGDLKVWITVGAAVAGAVAVFATAGGALAAGAALAAAGGGAWSNLIKEPPAPVEAPLGGSNPQAVLKKIEEALTKLNEQIRGSEEEIRTMLAGAQGITADGNKDGRTPFDLPLPKVDGPVLTRQSQLALDNDIIEKVTGQWIPTIVGDLHQARSKLTGDSVQDWERPDGIGLGFTGPHAEYKALEDTVIGLLSNTASELDEAGRALWDAARDLGQADNAAREKYAAIAKRINDSNDNLPGQ